MEIPPQRRGDQAGRAVAERTPIDRNHRMTVWLAEVTKASRAA